MTISQRIFFLMEKQGKKQKELSKFTGISTSTISAWNKRGTNPAADTISTIADFLEVTVDYLLTGKENQTAILTTDEQELLENYRQLTSDGKEEASKRVKELSIQDASNKEHDIEPVIPHSNASNINIYEQDLLRSFRELPFGEQMKIIGKVETLAEIFKSEENVG